MLSKMFLSLLIGGIKNYYVGEIKIKTIFRSLYLQHACGKGDETSRQKALLTLVHLAHSKQNRRTSLPTFLCFQN
jgi:hypothetical protein